MKEVVSQSVRDEAHLVSADTPGPQRLRCMNLGISKKTYQPRSRPVVPVQAPCLPVEIILLMGKLLDIAA